MALRRLRAGVIGCGRSGQPAAKLSASASLGGPAFDGNVFPADGVRACRFRRLGQVGHGILFAGSFTNWRSGVGLRHNCRRSRDELVNSK